MLEEARADPKCFLPPDIPMRARRRLGALGRDLIRTLLGNIASSAEADTLKRLALMLIYVGPAVLEPVLHTEQRTAIGDGLGSDHTAETSSRKRIQKNRTERF